MRKLLLFGLLVGGLGIGLVVQAGLVNAGPIRPEGPPASSSVTLNELSKTLERIEDNRYRPVELPSSTQATQAGSVLLTLTSAVSGQISGSVATAGHEGAINILGFNHEIVAPRDAATGLPTGKRQHKPISVTKPVDKSTPLLFSILVNNENITEFKLQFFQKDDTGKVVPYYTIELEDAKIVGITSETPNYEMVSFVYQKITWTFEDGGITAEDDWETPVV